MNARGIRGDCILMCTHEPGNGLQELIGLKLRRVGQLCRELH